jgi:hypothetical protein
MDLDGYLWVTQLDNVGGRHGLVKIDTATGTPLAFYLLPSTVGGLPISLQFPDDLAVLGLGLPRQNCWVTPTVTATRTPTSTLTASPTATPTTTLSPTRTATATSTSTQTPSPTPTVTDTDTFTAVPTSTPTATQTDTFSPTRTATTTLTPAPTSTAVADCHTQKALKIPSNVLTGSRDSFNILVKAMQTGSARVDIYREGLLVRTLWTGELVKCGTRVLSWDTRDDDGDLVASGVYTAVFRDASGALFKENCVVVR